MTAEDSTVARVPLGADVSWCVLCVPLRRECCLAAGALSWLGTLRPGQRLRQRLDRSRALGRGCGRVVEDGHGQYPWQSGRPSKQRGHFRDHVSGDPKSCTGPGCSVLRPPGKQRTEPDHPGFPADRLQAPRERPLFHLAPVSSLTPCAIIIKRVSSV